MGRGEHENILYFIQLQCSHSKVKFKDNPQCSNVRNFVLEIRKNDAVLVIKCANVSFCLFCRAQAQM